MVRYKASSQLPAGTTTAYSGKTICLCGIGESPPTGKSGMGEMLNGRDLALAARRATMNNIAKGSFDSVTNWVFAVQCICEHYNGTRGKDFTLYETVICKNETIII